MKNSIPFSFTLAMAVASLCAGDRKAHKGQVLMPQAYHGDEVTAKSGEKWLALVQQTNARDRIQAVPLKIEKVEDGIVDDPGIKTGKQVSTKRLNGTPLFFIKGVRGIVEGPIETVSNKQTLVPNIPIRLAMSSGRIYSLTLVCEVPPGKQEEAQSTAKLILEEGRTKQVLATYTATFQKGEFGWIGSDSEVRIFWVGDLNGDGKLDLLLDLSDHYNVSLPTLLLSPKASGPILVVEVAQHYSSGC